MFSNISSPRQWQGNGLKSITIQQIPPANSSNSSSRFCKRLMFRPQGKPNRRLKAHGPGSFPRLKLPGERSSRTSLRRNPAKDALASAGSHQPCTAANHPSPGGFTVPALQPHPGNSGGSSSSKPRIAASRTQRQLAVFQLNVALTRLAWAPLTPAIPIRCCTLLGKIGFILAQK